RVLEPSSGPTLTAWGIGSLKATAPLVAFRLPIRRAMRTGQNHCAEVLVFAVGFFFDDARTERDVDAPLDGRAFVILEVDGARESDEFRTEGLRALLVADVVFDHPQAFVDREQGVYVGRDIDLCVRRNT